MYRGRKGRQVGEEKQWEEMEREEFTLLIYRLQVRAILSAEISLEEKLNLHLRHFSKV